MSLFGVYIAKMAYKWAIFRPLARGPERPKNGPFQGGPKRGQKWAPGGQKVPILCQILAPWGPFWAIFGHLILKGSGGGSPGLVLSNELKCRVAIEGQKRAQN